MSTKNWRDIRRGGDADYEAKIAEKVVEMKVEEVAHGLNELRQRRDATQAQIAEIIGISASSLSRSERSLDPQLSTLRRYIEALGGHLRLVADFGDEEILLSIPLFPDELQEGGRQAPTRSRPETVLSGRDR